MKTAELRKPKHCMMTLRDSTLEPARVLDLSWMTLSPVGTVSHLPSSLGNFSPAEISLGLLISAPPSFLSGKLRIDITIADKSPKARTRRFVISKFIQAAKTKITADTASKAD